MNQIKQAVNTYFSIPASEQFELEDLDYCELYHDMLSFQAEAAKGHQGPHESYDLPW